MFFSYSKGIFTINRSGANLRNGRRVPLCESGQPIRTFIIANITKREQLRQHGLIDRPLFTGRAALPVRFPRHGISNRVAFRLGGPMNILGTSGNDSLTGSSAADLINGYDGNDSIDGGAGADTINGGIGNDTMIGGLGSDFFEVNTAGDVVVELSGTDSGNDTVRASIDFTLPANVENLVLAGTGPSQVVGNDSNNGFFVSGGIRTIAGGDGIDLVTMDYSHALYKMRYDGTYDPATGSGYLVIQSGLTGSGDDPNYINLTYSSIERFNITGTSKDDELKGGVLADTLRGGDGNDTLTSHGGADSLVGGAGADNLLDADFSSAASALSVTAGSTQKLSNGVTLSSIESFTNLSTGRGNDSILLSGLYGDSVSTNAGNDTIDPGRGRDTINAGTGIDLLVVDYSATKLPIVYYSYDVAAGNGDFSDASLNDATYSGIERFDITGGSGADDLRGGDRNDSLHGGAGADILRSRVGVDVVDGGTGQDSLEADLSGAKIDLTIRSGSSNLFSNGGEVTSIEIFADLKTGAGNDKILTSGIFSDHIATNAGNDILNPGRGRDTIDGGAGIDVLVLNYSASSHPIFYYRFDAATGTGDISDANGNEVEYSGIERFNLTGSSEADNLNGGRLSDTLKGGAGADKLLGADSVARIGVTDTLLGGSEADLFCLGDSAGIFYDDGRSDFKGKNDYAKIMDFTVGEDRLQLKGSAPDYILGTSPLGEGKGLYFDGSGTDELIAVVMSKSTLTAANLIGTALYQ